MGQAELEQALLAPLPAALSEPTVRQVRWAARELARFATTALDTSGAPTAPADLRSWLLSGEVVEAWLAAAARGELAVRATSRPPSPASLAARRTVARSLARWAQLPPPKLRVPQPQPADRLTPFDATVLRATAAGLAARGTNPELVRAWALLAVGACTAARTGELADMRISDVDLRAGLITVRHRPQGPGAGLVDQYELDDDAKAALQAWLRVREDLVEGRGGRSALWVSVAANHRPGAAGGEVRVPPGVPLLEQGVAMAYARAVARANMHTVFAGPAAASWPLPRRHEPFRLGAAARRPTPDPDSA